jgi:hypothetical protein
LIFSQVVLSLQRSFAVIPLVMLTANRAKTGVFVAPRWLIAIAGLIAAVIVALNVKLVVDFVLSALSELIRKPRKVTAVIRNAAQAIADKAALRAGVLRVRYSTTTSKPISSRHLLIVAHCRRSGLSETISKRPSTTPSLSRALSARPRSCPIARSVTEAPSKGL